MQLRDAKERENSWKKFRVSIEKQNAELKATIAEKDEELKIANQKIEQLVMSMVGLDIDKIKKLEH